MLFDDVRRMTILKRCFAWEAALLINQRMLLMLPLLPVTFTSTFLNTK